MTDARKALRERLGSTIISRVGFRDNYVIIGKHGLPSGSAIEAVSSPDSTGDTLQYINTLEFIYFLILCFSQGNVPTSDTLQV